MFRLAEGNTLYILANYDLSTVTDLVLLCQRANGTRFTKAVEVIDTPTTVDGVTWLGNTYGRVEFSTGDLTTAGVYDFQLQCRIAGALAFGAIFTKEVTRVLA